MRIPALMLLLLAAMASPAQADTFAVDRGDDTDAGECTAAPNDCSLRGALAKANDTNAADTITLPALRMVIDETLPTQGRLTIAGAGARASIVDAAGSVGAVFITNGEVTLRDLTVTGALAEPESGEGAVSNVGVLRLERVAIVDNRSIGLTSTSDATVVGSLIARNVGPGGGGIDNMAFLHLLDSTVTDNTAAPLGLASHVVGAGVASFTGFVTVEHSTIARNRAAPGVALLTAANLGIVAPPGLDHGAVVRSSVIGDGSGARNCAGRIASHGGNVDSDGTCGLTLANDRVADPRLAPLADNGGPTSTRALLDDSPAIGAAVECGSTDQRGTARPQARCDSGAFESPLDGPVAPKPDTARPDTTPPRLRVRGVAKTVTRRAFNAGLKVRVSADEPITAELSLLAGSRRRLLSSGSLALGPGARTVTLRPKRRLTGSRAIKARVRVVATDGAANATVRSIAFRVR